jgi:hypothetical protein
VRPSAAVVVCGLVLLRAVPLFGQVAEGSVSGAVTSAAGVGIAGATVSVTQQPSGQHAETRADSSGRFTIPNLGAGDFVLVVSAPGYDSTTLTMSLAAAERKNVNVTLTEQLSLGDLGFSPGETQGSLQDQERLNRRSHMLKIHQELGLVTAASFLATLLTSGGAGSRVSSPGARDLHAGLGVITVGLYGTTAWYALSAPKIAGTPARGPIRLHKALAWIHGPGMILTPILGEMAFDQRSRGERVTGIASAHGAVAAVTAAAFGAAMLSIAIKF